MWQTSKVHLICSTFWCYTKVIRINRVNVVSYENHKLIWWQWQTHHIHITYTSHTHHTHTVVILIRSLDKQISKWYYCTHQTPMRWYSFELTSFELSSAKSLAYDYVLSLEAFHYSFNLFYFMNKWITKWIHSNPLTSSNFNN